MDKQVQIEILLAVSKALQQVEGLSESLKTLQQPAKGKTATKQTAEDAGEATEKFKTLKKEIKEVALEIEKLQRGKSSKMFGDVDTALSQYKRLTSELSNLESTMATSNAKSIEQQMLLQHSTRAKLLRQQNTDIARQNLEANQQYWKDEETAIKRRSDLIRQQMTPNDALAKQNLAANKQYWLDEENSIRRRSALIRQQMELKQQEASIKTKPLDYETELAKLRKSAQVAYMAGDKAGFDKHKQSFDDLNSRLVQFNKQFGVYNRGFYDLGSSVDYFFAKLRYRLAA